MRDSISLISYAGCLGLSPVMLAKINFLSMCRSLGVYPSLTASFEENLLTQWHEICSL